MRFSVTFGRSGDSGIWFTLYGKKKDFKILHEFPKYFYMRIPFFTFRFDIRH